MIQVGSKVYPRGFRHGQPGIVLRIERRRVVVLWRDLDYIARHPLESLVEAAPQEQRIAGGPITPPPETQPGREDPYTRLRRKLDADNKR